MLQLRYNGCPDCLKSTKYVLAQIGMFENRSYTVEFHKDHPKDRIYKSRPDYIKQFTGAILYRPDKEAWIDFYDPSHERMVLSVKDAESRKELLDSIKSLLEL